MPKTSPLFRDIYRGKTVLVTGHSGFKGSWLSLWLTELGAKVIGYSLPPPSKPSHWTLLGLEQVEPYGDINQAEKLRTVFEKHRPEIVFHLAAQPLVRDSYVDPVGTYMTNVMGTMQVYEACRLSSSVRAVVSATTDKVYENKEWDWGYRESDRLGGHDPYSSSKACAEILSDSYRKSFLHTKAPQRFLLATARAGNVIGGGDWAKDRIIPDIARAAAKNEVVVLRNPDSVRPWEHVLDPLSGYLMLGEKLLQGDEKFACSWNFGPSMEDKKTVLDVVNTLQSEWPSVQYRIDPPKEVVHEARLLKLDCSKARNQLGWIPVWDVNQAIRTTAQWYQAYQFRMEVVSAGQLREFVSDAGKLGLTWARGGSKN